MLKALKTACGVGEKIILTGCLMLPLILGCPGVEVLLYLLFGFLAGQMTVFRIEDNGRNLTNAQTAAIILCMTFLFLPMFWFPSVGEWAARQVDIKMDPKKDEREG